MAEIGGETVVSGQPDVVRGGDDDVGDDATFEAGHPVGQYPCRDPADRGEAMRFAAARDWSAVARRLVRLLETT